MQEELKRVLLKNIVPDENQPRKHFAEVPMQELTDSIKEHGVKQPVLLRPVKSRNKDRYQLVTGERRYRASLAAGLDDIPAMIQDMTDKEALDIQITENLQRENINPMEEAEAFNNIIKGKVYTVDGLSARLAKRSVYIRQRLRLCELTDEWKELVYAGRLRVTDAYLVCRFAPDVQKQWYTQYVPKDWATRPEGWVLPAMHVTEKTKNLNEAPFKTEDPTLNPSIGACGQCPYNSHFSQLQFEGQEGNRICSNPACYGVKEQNSNKRKLEEIVKTSEYQVVAGGVYSAAAKDQLQMAEQMGAHVLKSNDYEILKQPELLSKEKLMKAKSWQFNGKSEEEQQAVYEEYVEEVKKDEADYNFKKTMAKKAYVVAADYGGLQQGEVVEIYVPPVEDEEDQELAKIEQQIQKLESEKLKDIKQTNSAFLKDVAAELKNSDGYWNNEKALELKDTLAVFHLLMTETWEEPQLLDDMKAEWGSEKFEEPDLISGIVTTARTNFLYKWTRRFVLDQITAYDSITDAGGLCLRLLAERYIPKRLEELSKEYKFKQKQIIDAANGKIAALKQTQIVGSDQGSEPTGENPVIRGKLKGLRALLQNVDDK